ncbi:MAG: MOSC domain-containing protein [Firmicutes bacterium]|nr:MOSC domain-containing protein [Bacillota bacterium]
MKGKVIGLAIGERRGESKKPVSSAEFKAGFGIIGDAHAGTYKQVSLMDEDLAREIFQKHNVLGKPGDFADNVRVDGISLARVKVGDTIKLGQHVTLKVVQIGKVLGPDHTFNFHGQVPLAEKGIFATVETGGQVQVGDSVEIIPG